MVNPSILNHRCFSTHHVWNLVVGDKMFSSWFISVLYLWFFMTLGILLGYNHQPGVDVLNK